AALRAPRTRKTGPCPRPRKKTVACGSRSRPPHGQTQAQPLLPQERLKPAPEQLAKHERSIRHCATAPLVLRLYPPLNKLPSNAAPEQFLPLDTFALGWLAERVRSG